MQMSPGNTHTWKVERNFESTRSFGRDTQYVLWQMERVKACLFAHMTAPLIPLSPDAQQRKDAPASSSGCSSPFPLPPAPDSSALKFSWEAAYGVNEVSASSRTVSGHEGVLQLGFS